jgi:hypothetical protein
MRFRLILVLVAVVGGACGQPTPSPSAATVVPYVVSSQTVVGPNRFLFSFLDKSGNTPVAAPDRTASVAFIPKGSTQPVATGNGRFIWGIEGVRGIYVTSVTLPSAGDYTARFTTEAPNRPPETIDMQVQVLDKATGITVGDKAPASRTLTLKDVGGNVKAISSDKSPVERFYTTSVADAVAAKKPFVLAFATPAFCQTQQCGPTLDHVKNVAARYPDLTFINVEPYQLTMKDGTLQPVLSGDNQLQPVPAVSEWGIVSEPWIFVVDKEGVVRGSFEGILAEDELSASIDSVLKD